MDEFSLPVRLFLKAYRWRRIDPVPWTPLRKPLNECKLALVTTAGFYLQNQDPFDQSNKAGDPSFRTIPAETKLNDLRENHRSDSFDHSGLSSDPNLAFPLDRAKELASAGQIGAVNHRHLSFMGSILTTGALRTRTAPEAARLLTADAVDIALLTPV